MEIDNFKTAWKNDKTGDTTSLPDTISGSSSSAIARVRRSMKNEFIATIFSYLILVGSLFRHPQTTFFFNLACIMLFSLTVLLAYYFTRFYLFYQSISNYNSNLRASLSKATYELELNMELYKTFNLCTTPLAVIIALGVVWGKGASELIYKLFSTEFTLTSILVVFGSILIAFMATYFFIGIHVNRSYGRQLTALKKLLADLENEAVI